MRRLFQALMSAIAFMTRLPVPQSMQGLPDGLSSAAMFFPLVGLIVGAGAIAVNHVLSRFVPHNVVLIVILIFLVGVTGGFHEDALADAADGFGGGWAKDQVLTIMHDSRVGSFGALAIALALLARFVFLANIPSMRLDSYLMAGQVTCRWTALPLAYLLPSARRESGQGARLAGKITMVSLATGTLLAVVIMGVALGMRGLWVGLAAMLVTAATGAYYRHRLGGVTGDCLGATNQLAEVAIYFTGVVLG
jgi:adenosylcobinamide-GDP ribazoletransferase